MRVTPNAIQGECMALIKHQGWPIYKEYPKGFYDKKFVVAVGRQLQNDCIDYTVKLAERKEDFVLRVH